MATFQIDGDMLADVLLRRDVSSRKAISRGIRAAAERARVELVKATNELNKVFTGTFKNAHRVRPGLPLNDLASCEIVNDAPYAGIIERGARPHGVNKEGRDAIQRWCELKLGLDTKSAHSVTWAICERLKTHGQKGTFMVFKRLNLFTRWLRDEVTRELEAVANRGP